MSDLVIKAYESWDGFTIALVYDDTVGLHRVVQIKNGAAIRSLPIEGQIEPRDVYNRTIRDGQIPLAYRPDDYPTMHPIEAPKETLDQETGEIITLPPGYGRFG